MIVALAAPGSSEKGSAGGARTLLVQTGCRTEIPRVRGDNTAVVHFDARAWPEAALRTALEECGGPIKTLHPVKPAGGKHVISGLSSVAVEFKDAQSAEKLRRARVVSRTKTTQSVREWARRHHQTARCNAKELQAEVDSLMARFDANQRAKHRASAKATRVDADGFQLVSGKRRRRRGQGDDGSMTAGEKRRRKKGPMELANFYRFQLRESKRDQLAMLRAKFEQDKERVKRLQKANPFKP